MRRGALSLVLVLAAVSLGIASPGYYCQKAASPIRVDGRLDEAEWKNVPWIPFRGLVDGSAPKQARRAKMLWDDKFLYLAFEVGTANVRGALGKEAGEPRTLDNSERSKFIMFSGDPFLKIYLDPDGDGRDYFETHLNALNNVNDIRLARGSIRNDRLERLRLDLTAACYDLSWDCEGLRSAVSVRGTLNDPRDKDEGWTAEIAFPWSSLAKFTLGSCPPEPGDVWRAHLGYRERRNESGEGEAEKHRYWAWPVMGVADFHQPDRYGFVNFSAESAARGDTASAGSDEKTFKWKVVWHWTRGKKPFNLISLAKSLGFNAIQTDNREMADAAHKAGLSAVGVVRMYAPKESAQVILEEEGRRLSWMKEEGLWKDLSQGGGEPILGGEIAQFRPWCWNRPEALVEHKKLIGRLLGDGCDILALDWIGFQNFYACFCPVCRRKHIAFKKKHPELPPEAALQRYSENCLVSLCNELIRYAKAKKPDVVIMCHMWPHFAPNPLYGNRVEFDYIGDTVSWFFKPYWEYDKVKWYTEAAVRGASRFHKNQRAMPFIGIFSHKPLSKHRKSPERLRREIRIVKDSGAKAIQFAELGHIASDEELMSVLREELGGTKAPKP